MKSAQHLCAYKQFGFSGKAARKMFVKLTADWSDGQRLLHGRPGPREVPCRLLPVSSAEVGHPNLVT